MQDQPTQARRTKVKGRRSIYFCETSAGRRYEVTYLDSTGRRRWKTVDGNLQDAQAALDDLNVRKRRGERIAPTRAAFAEIAAAWLEAQEGRLRLKTIETYHSILRTHLNPRLGRLRIVDVTVDDVAAVVSDMERRGYAGWTVRGVLTVAGRVFGYAVRRGLIADNPTQRLERGERPKVGKRELRVLDREEIGRLLRATSPKYRPLVATAIFTGLRQGKLLGLTWADVDLQAGVIEVRRQLDRRGKLVAPKTEAAIREVVLMPALGRLLKEHKSAAFSRGRAKPEDVVFASEVGTCLGFRNIVRRGLEPALQKAKLPRMRWHDLRHCYASLLIGDGANVVFVSRQLGHASPTITLSVYSHLFERTEHAQRTRNALEEGFGHLLA